MKHYITLDIGGTFIKYGILSGQGEVLIEGSLPTEADKGGEQVFQNALTIIKELLEKDFTISGIGIGTSGMINEKGVVVKSAPHFPGWAGIELGPRLESQFKLPVRVGNDVNVMALAERHFGDAKGIDNFVFLAIGTGIGAGLFINGRPYVGLNGAAAEVGSLRASRDFTSFWEKEASTSAFIAKARKVTGDDNLQGPEVFERYRKGDAQAISFVKSWAEELIKGIADVIVMIDPQVIYLGGAIVKEAEIFLPLLEEYRDHYVLHNFKVPFRVSRLQGHIGLLGAVSLLI